ncbi:hypothetical protein DdX_22299 [Ditylenchus destructor]|uniref:Uncharacterized protein n=1 Tax=Ditylenchus destructor TaxID=166010 RepID=A0AAD4MF20_9BILA|nr:hypothetical protein DdX_22299 [Ditylenchus destructor]
MKYIQYLLLLFIIEIAKCKVRECHGDGHYVDYHRVVERANSADCGEIPHNLTMGEDEDTPDTACKHKYCPSCILVMRKHCGPHKNLPYCAKLRDKVGSSDEMNNLASSIGVHCDGLHGDMEKKRKLVLKLIDDKKATPYLLCKAFELC